MSKKQIIRMIVLYSMSAMVFLGCIVVCIVRNLSSAWIMGDIIGVIASLLPPVVIFCEYHRIQSNDSRERTLSTMKIHKAQTISFIAETVASIIILFCISYP